MPKADLRRMRAALFVEVEGETFLVALPYERMKLLLPLAAALFDDGKLDLSPTKLFDFNAALESVMVPHGVPASELTEQAAYDMGAKGAQATERERLLFEAWMRGHCWALCATWDGKQYVSDAEQGGDLDPRAMATRRLFAAWRDRAALGVPASQEALPNVPPGKWKVDMPDGLYTEMPGDPPGPCDLRKVIGGYVYFVTPRSGKLVALNPPRNAGVPASAVKWCPECRSAGVVGIEQDVCPTCNGTGKVADGVAMPWKPPPYPATPTEREALAKRRAALGVKEGS